MLIDIKQNPLDGNWDVIGPDHTDSFWTQANAIAFAKSFYKTSKVVKATTNAKCLEYQTTLTHCNCKAFEFYPGPCKHMVHLRGNK